MTTLSDLSEKEMIETFNMWADAYKNDPSAFKSILDDEGKAYSDYGENAKATFLMFLGKTRSIDHNWPRKNSILRG